MNFVEAEGREKEVASRFRTYRNVNRVPFLIKLPLPLFWRFAFGGLVAALVGLGLLVAHFWLIGLIVFGAIGGTYFILVNLVKKYGDDFMDKIISYYTMNTFSEVIVRRRLKNPS